MTRSTEDPHAGAPIPGVTGNEAPSLRRYYCRFITRFPEGGVLARDKGDALAKADQLKHLAAASGFADVWLDSAELEIDATD